MRFNVELTTKKRADLIAKMHETTRKVATTCAEKLAAASKIGAVVYYDMGAAIKEIYDSASISADDKQKELKKLSAYLGKDFSLTMLANLKNVATVFTREKIVGYLESPMENGKYLTWSHFYELQKISNEGRREKLIQSALKNSWSAKDLALELTSNQESDIKRSGGRKPSVPKSPNAMLQKLINSTQSTANYVDIITDPLTAALGEMDLAEADPAFVGNLDAALQQVEETTQRLSETKAQLLKWQKKIIAKQKA
jgi:hypothetical protein